MQILIREIRELLRGPEFLAVLLVCLLLGADESAAGWVVEGSAWIEDRIGRILASCPCPQLPETLQRILPLLR